jgi:hypothetical protein
VAGPITNRQGRAFPVGLSVEQETQIVLSINIYIADPDYPATAAAGGERKEQSGIPGAIYR